MRTGRGLSAFTLLLPGALCSCAIGLDSVLFTTKTGVAVDADSQPPALDIGYARQELVVAPVFERGEVLPVLTTLNGGAGASTFTVTQSFATGDAAVIMAEALTSADHYFDTANGKESREQMHLRPRNLGYVETRSSDTDVPRGLWQRVKYFFAGATNRQRYFFGTDTSVGLHVEWDASEVPRAMSFGYKRKELAFVPLIEEDLKTNPSDRQSGSPVNHQGRPLQGVKLASLIATVGQDTRVSSPSRTGVQLNQAYATGDAATLLAAHPEIRRVLVPSLIPGVKAFENEKATFDAQAAAVKTITDKFNSAGNKQAIIQKAIDLAIVDAGTDESNFLQRLRDFVDRTKPERTTRLAELDESIS